jgi:hypothetical protein
MLSPKVATANAITSFTDIIALTSTALVYFGLTELIANLLREVNKLPNAGPLLDTTSTVMFRELDRDIEAATKHLRESIGMDDKVVEAYVSRQMERIEAGLSWDDEAG